MMWTYLMQSRMKQYVTSMCSIRARKIGLLVRMISNKLSWYKGCWLSKVDQEILQQLAKLDYVGDNHSYDLVHYFGGGLGNSELFIYCPGYESDTKEKHR